jgi:glutathione reductase (NADPH)
MQDDFDAIVLGGGSAGLAFSKQAAAHGASVLLVERNNLGGTCVNRGCVPKKMMWAVADALRTQRGLLGEGIIDGAVSLDMKSMTRKRDARISEIILRFGDELSDRGITRLTGTATMMSPGQVSVGDRLYHTDRIVMATGARPSPLDIPGAELTQTSDDVFGWTSAPARLVVIGAGYIGTEMAAIFHALGSDVVLVSDGAAVLSEFSPANQSIAAENLAASGVRIETQTVPRRIEGEGTDLIVYLDNGEVLQATHVLNATGRDPNVDAFGDLEVPRTAQNGALHVNEQFETSMPGVYAIGDIADRLPLTPVAREDGDTLARQLFDTPDITPIDLELVSTTAFVFPPIGEAGDTSGARDITRFTAMETILQDTSTQEGWAISTSEKGALNGIAVTGHAAAEAASWGARVIEAGQDGDRAAKATAVHPSAAEEPLGSLVRCRRRLP